MRFFILFLILNINYNIANTQISDSLKNILNTPCHDTIKCSVYMELIEDEESLDVWSKYNDELYRISTLNLSKLKKGTIEYNTFLRYKAAYFNNTGWISNHKGDVTKAINYYHKSLKIYETLKRYNEIAILYGNIGRIWNTQGEFDKSIEYYKLAIDLNIKCNNKSGEAFGYNNLAAIFKKKGDFENALKYCYKGLEIMIEENDEKGMATLYTNIGTLLGKTNKETQGLEYLLKGLDIKQKIKDTDGEALSLSLIGNLYLKMGKTDKALEYGIKSYNINLKLGYPDNIRRSAELLKNIYTKNRNYKKALEMFEVYIVMKDSIYNDANRKASLENQLQYEYEKKSAIDSIKISEEKKLHQAKLSESNAKLKQEQTFRIALYSGLVLVIIFSIFIFNRFKITQKQNTIIQHQKKLVEEQKEIVEDKQKEILDSIAYAKRLQDAILPPLELINENLVDSFILFKPKDIVAGDFYWAEKIEDIFFIAAADSTGHGVPGAMVSVVCCNALNRSVLEFGLKDPGEILNKTRELVLTTFAKSNQDVKDGMDISLCVFNKINNTICWSGANNPLWYFSPFGGGDQRSGDVVLKEIKANKQPIGKTDNPLPFTTHHLELKKGDALYLFTDGYADQFGGPKGKKFKYKQLQETLKNISHLDMLQQKKELEISFSSWIGKYEQIDDVTIIGIRI